MMRISIAIAIIALAAQANADTALTAAQLAPACKPAKTDPSSTHAQHIFEMLPRKPAAQAKLLLACGTEPAALFVMTYASLDDATAETHVLGESLAGPGAAAPDADVLVSSGKTVVIVSPASPAAVKALAAKGYVAYAKGGGGGMAGKTTAQLIDVFRGTDYDAMDGAIAALVAQGAAAVPALSKALADPKPMVRSQSAAALGKIGKPSAPAIAALTKLLTDPDNDNRWNAANALGGIGPAAKSALPALKQLEADKVAPIAKAAADAEAKIAAK
jgi:HEAT repeat protein